MNRIFCIVVAGVTRWLTGTSIGEDYGRVTGTGRGHPNPGIVFGVIGAFLGIYLFPWAAIGAVGSSCLVSAAVIGSMILVGRLANPRRVMAVEDRSMIRSGPRN